MKKNLFSLLPLSAVVMTMASGAVLAQSGISLYGVADAGLVVENGNGRHTNISSGVASGSRIGFKGKEDLGGGLAANFVLESGFSLDTGASGQGGLLFGRQAYVGLSGTAGAVTLGRQYSPYYLALRDIADPFVIGLAGTASNLMETNIRINNMVQYSTPKVNGFGADVAYGFGEKPDSNTSNRSIGATLSYDNGPLTASLNHHRHDNVGATDQSKNTLLAAKYNFRVLQVHLGYADNKALAAVKSNDVLLGLTVPFGANSLLVSYIRHNDKSAANLDASQWALGGLHRLSKRTDLYLAYARINNQNGAAFKVGNATDDGTGNSGINLGMRHTF
ncbi:porin [Janthinobacterium agaricidamnosum]|uniref:Gram-negative porin family protein n=1 Tax=Janthinobacterium agaricidamnosum NBRC 102515 = DSM 9628 TaxID=1349767 RepID=W0UZP4_9BURK|nr:porin [Janthinobacterium agaricidamnosum]CDG80850.1 gram-negative porin family protein [Janthinobacterium agaricidamnosum NBRC 102515 = DSM 9628]